MKPGAFKRLLPLLLIIFLSAGCAPTQALRPVGNSASPGAVDVSEVRFKTDDGLTLRGNLFGVRGRGGGEVGVVLAHMFSADQASWFAFARELAESGYLVMTFDFRGYRWSQGTKDIASLDRDMSAAARFMKRRTKKVFFVGAGMGGTAALRAASEFPAAGVATLSAPERFRGLSVGNEWGAAAGAKLFLASGRDRGAAETARRLYEAADEPRELEIIPGAAHGTNMLRAPGPAVRDVLVVWLAKHR